MELLVLFVLLAILLRIYWWDLQHNHGYTRATAWAALRGRTKEEAGDRTR